MATAGKGQRPHPRSWGESWPTALAAAIAISIALWLLLGWIPSRITTWLDERGLDPRLRDAVVAGVFTLGFVLVAWTVRRLQRGGRI